VHQWLRAQSKTFFLKALKRLGDAAKNASQSRMTIEKLCNFLLKFLINRVEKNKVRKLFEVPTYICVNLSVTSKTCHALYRMSNLHYAGIFCLFHRSDVSPFQMSRFRPLVRVPPFHLLQKCYPVLHLRHCRVNYHLHFPRM
jgi:hypothetical protein